MHQAPHAPRIPPLDPPYAPEIAAVLARWMPPGFTVEPLKLFRTLVKHREIFDRMRPLGAGLLGQLGTLDPRERELVIDRTCARCGCQYEWGVHVVAFGQALGIPEEQLLGTATRSSAEPGWSERQALLLQLVDELHDTSTVSDVLWARLETRWSEPQLIELVVLVGWYHLIAFFANAARVAPEEWAARFPADDAGRAPA
jgi:alkylhydroperoxidase family enzyme